MKKETLNRVLEQQKLFRQLDKAVKKIVKENGIAGPFMIEGVDNHPESLRLYMLAAAKEGENPAVNSKTPVTGGVVC